MKGVVNGTVGVWGQWGGVVNGAVRLMGRGGGGQLGCG